MATPKGMPEYAKGTASAIAASKKEAELTKKAKATPLAKAPAPAISNAMATANSNTNKYDVAKANQNAFNAAQKATIAKQVEKQAPTPSVETFKKAVQPPSGVTGVAVDALRSAFGLPPVSVEATTKPAPSAQQDMKQAFAGAITQQPPATTLGLAQTSGVGKATPTVVPSTQQPTGAVLGEMAKPVAKTPQQIASEQAATASLAEQQRRAMEEKAPVTPAPTVQQKPRYTIGDKEVSFQDYEASQQARYLKAVADQDFALADRLEADAKSLGWKLPEKQLAQQSQQISQQIAQNLPDQGLKNIEAGIGTADAFAQKLREIQGQPASQIVAEQQANETPIIKGTPTEAEKVPDGFKDERGYTWNDVAGQWESPDVWANTVANRKKMELPAPTVDQGLIDLQKEIAGTDALEQQFRNVSREQEPMVRTQPFGEPVVEEQPPQFDNYPSQYARAVVDKQIADANRQIDLQIAEATRNRDLQTAQNLQAYKRAINDMRDKGFMQNQQLMQQMANRGMLTSGIAADAQTRLQMSMNQNIRDIAVKNQASQDKINADFKTAFDKLAQKQKDLETNREGDVEKIVKGIQADNREIAKLDTDLRKLQLEENKMLISNAQDVLKRYADQGYDTSAFEPYILSFNVQGLAQAMSQSGQRPLSLLGKDMLAKIEETNSKLILNKRDAERKAMETKQALSQIDKQRSESTGFVYQNGVPLKDAKGNYMMTEEAEQFIKKLQAQADEVRQSNAVKTAALNWEKIVDVGKMDIAERKLKQDEAQFISRMNQDYTIALNKLTSQDARDALANRIEFGKSLLNSANAELSNLINTKANKQKITNAMARQYAAKQLLGNEVGVPYRDEVMESLLSEK